MVKKKTKNSLINELIECKSAIDFFNKKNKIIKALGGTSEVNPEE